MEDDNKHATKSATYNLSKGAPGMNRQISALKTYSSKGSKKAKNFINSPPVEKFDENGAPNEAISAT